MRFIIKGLWGEREAVVCKKEAAGTSPSKSNHFAATHLHRQQQKQLNNNNKDNNNNSHKIIKNSSNISSL